MTNHVRLQANSLHLDLGVADGNIRASIPVAHPGRLLIAYHAGLLVVL